MATTTCAISAQSSRQSAADRPGRHGLAWLMLSRASSTRRGYFEDDVVLEEYPEGDSEGERDSLEEAGLRKALSMDCRARSAAAHARERASRLGAGARERVGGTGEYLRHGARGAGQYGRRAQVASPTCSRSSRWWPGPSDWR